MSDIFLSYAREDITRAQLFAEALAGIRWVVDLLGPQHRARSRLRRTDSAAARPGSAGIVVLRAEHSVKSPFVRHEAAAGHGGRLVPVIIDRVKPPLGFRPGLSDGGTERLGGGHFTGGMRPLTGFDTGPRRFERAYAITTGGRRLHQLQPP